MRSMLHLLLMLGAGVFCAAAVSAQEGGSEAKPAAGAAPEAEHAEGTQESKPADEKPAEADHGAQGDDHSAAGADHGAAGGGHAGEHGGDAHGGAHDDVHGMGHGNAGPNQSKPEEWKYDLAIYTLIVFFLLVAILGKFAWGPIAQGLEKREHAIAGMISDAQRNQEEAKALLANYESKLAASQEEIREMYAQARREAEGISAKIVADAQAAAVRERERAVAEIDQAKNAALSEVASKSVDIAMGLAGKIVRRQITGEDHKALVQEAVEGIARHN